MEHENDLRTKVCKIIRKLDPIPVENSACPGTPDINFRSGWIELKKLKAWPKRDLPVLMPHFHPGQIAWILRRTLRGGLVLFLLNVGKEYILLDGAFAAERIGKATQSEIREKAIACFPTMAYMKKNLAATLGQCESEHLATLANRKKSTSSESELDIPS